MITSQQALAFQDISRSIRTTQFGEGWPPEYRDFFHRWGYLNAIYNTLCEANKEWKIVARFALDDQFGSIWSSLKGLDSTRELASQPCVGNGRDAYKPEEHVRIAFRTLRNEFGVDVASVCSSPKCQRREQQCMNLTLVAHPHTVDQNNPGHAIYTPFGATLTILYQIRNNLFHGSKIEIHNQQWERNILLTREGANILQAILEEFIRRFPASNG